MVWADLKLWGMCFNAMYVNFSWMRKTKAHKTHKNLNPMKINTHMVLIIRADLDGYSVVNQGYLIHQTFLLFDTM